ncbi:YihY/virulence factor BrkB family protein [Kitasatospora sp. CB01950]|uniref:YihY/virulence factor BrkB family protein n=1 Tax=Kitasatospora sp. CB01950 TaxID=1703930 RepID=UPI00093DAD8F|nr:YihY/virulence factor BrkB family protein [Kitasatospora sp. CB01950]OKJ17255.1 hypothetical protein AMK19_04035 [Kitasatospora sp. CB01950]
MDFLARLPLIGPLLARVLRSRPYLVYRLFAEVQGNRLAGAVTFFGFLALFPLLTVALAIALATLSDSRVHHLQEQIAEQLPGLADSLDLNAMVANAGTVGLVSGALLLVSGLGWVDTMRGAVRTVWRLPDDAGNPVQVKLRDCAVLFGLGLVCLASLAASALATTLAHRLADRLGLDGGGARWLLSGLGFLIAVCADLLLFWYLLGPFPRIRGQHRRALLQGALIGAVGFEVLKIALSSYLGSVAGRSVYGAFGVPVALLLWINFVARLLMYSAAWTALADPEAARRRAVRQAEAALATAVESAQPPPVRHSDD